MKDLFTIILVLCTTFMGFSQYHITYKLKYQDSEGEYFRSDDGYSWKWQEYYVMDGYYKSKFDGGSTWIQVYSGSDNKYFNIDAHGNIEKLDASTPSPGSKLVNIRHIDSVAVVAGYKCKIIELDYDDYFLTYLYASNLKVNPESFKEHNYGDWNKIIQATDGGLPLKFVTQYDSYSVTGEATVVEKMDLDKDYFKVKKIIKDIKSNYDEEFEIIRENFLKKYSHSELDISKISSTTIYGTTLLGDVSFPTLYTQMKPFYSLIKNSFAGGYYIDGVYDSVKWSYDPMEAKVYKSLHDYETEYFELFTEYLELLNFDDNKTSIMDLRESEEVSNSIRVVVAEDDKRITYYFDKNSHLMTGIQKEEFFQLLQKYQEFRGIPMATRLEIKLENQDMVMSQDSVKFNIDYDPSYFYIPDSLASIIEEINVELTADEHFILAEELATDENYLEAIKSYEKAVNMDPVNSKYHNQLGMARLKEKNIYGAISAFSKAYELSPQFHVAIYNLGYSKMSLGDTKAAIIDFNKAISINENRPDYFNYRGLCYFKLKKYDTAMMDFAKTIELDSMFKIGYWNIAMSAYNLQKLDTAISFYNKSEKVGYVRHDLYNYRGICHYKKGDYEKALIDFTKAVESNQTVLNYYGNLANTYSKLGNSKKAISNYKVTIYLDSTYAGGYNSIGLEFYHDQSYDQAIKYFSDAIRLESNNAEFYDNRGRSKEYKMDYLGAIEDYSKSINLYPDDPNIYYWRATAKINVNDKFDACRDFKAAAELGLKEAEEALKEYCTNN